MTKRAASAVAVHIILVSLRANKVIPVGARRGPRVLRGRANETRSVLRLVKIGHRRASLDTSQDSMYSKLLYFVAHGRSIHV
jgi:hypothetical protein